MPAAQAVRDSTTVSEKQSLGLVKNLVRIALYNIAWSRGLFPEDFFHVKEVPALKMKINKLAPADEEARRLIDWMEKGVWDALQRKYLRTMVFAICEDETTTPCSLLEEYTFSFSYAADGTCNMELQAGGKKRAAAGSSITADQMKSAACKLLRTLSTLMRTLDDIPEKRTLVVKLFYTPDTPDEYEPPFFRSCGEDEQLTWEETPLKMKVGDLDAKHLTLALKVRSLLDPVENDEEQQGSQQSSSQEASSASESSQESEPRPTQDASKGGKQAPAAVQSTAATDSAAETQDPAFEDDVLRSVQLWLISKGEGADVDLIDFLARFTDVTVPLMEALTEKLVVDGTLKRTGKETFRVAGTNGPKGGTARAAARDPADARKATKTGPEAPALCSQGASTGMWQLGETVPGLGVPTAGLGGAVPVVAEDDSKGDLAAEDDAPLYNLALSHILAMSYVNATSLQEKLGGGISKDQCSKLIERAVEEGLVARTVNPRHRGQRVHRNATAAARLKEVNAAMAASKLLQQSGKRPRAEDGGADVSIVDSQAAYATGVGSADTGSNAVKPVSTSLSTLAHDSDKADVDLPAAGRRLVVAPEISSSKGVKQQLVGLGAYESQDVGAVSTVSQRLQKASVVKDPISKPYKKPKTGGS